MTISLKQVYQALEEASEAYTLFYDTKTGQTVYLPDVFIAGERNEELEEEIENNPGRYLRFPTKTEIHDYQIMKQFIYSLPMSIERKELVSSVHGKGAFRKFKATVRHYGMEKQWYTFREEALRQMAVEWCKENHLTPDDVTD